MQNASSKPPTIIELAEKLGISHSTVSRALNDHPAISALTKKRVHDEASRAGYIANSAARMLKQESSRVFGLVIPDIKNTFYTSVAKIIAESAATHGWQLILATTDDEPEREMRAVLSLLEARAEGVIISPSVKPLPNTIAMLNRLNTVQLLRVVKALNKSSSVEVDDSLGMELATSHLLDQGHTRIAYIGGLTSLSTGKNRFKGYEKALKKRNIQLQPELCAFGLPRAVFGAKAFFEMIPMAPTAIVIAGPEMAEGVLVEAVHRKIAVPGAVSIVSYGEQSWHEVIPGGISSVRLPEQEVAHAAFELMVAKKNDNVLNRVCIQPSLVTRGSSARVRRA